MDEEEYVEVNLAELLNFNTFELCLLVCAAVIVSAMSALLFITLPLRRLYNHYLTIKTN